MQYLLLFFIFLLAGCTNNVKPTQPIAELLGKPRDDKAVLITYRLDGSPRFFSVDNMINDQSLGKLKRSEFSWQYFDPGTYTLHTNWSQAALIPASEREMTLEGGQYYLVEVLGRVSVSTSLESRDFTPSTTALKIGSYDEAIRWLNDCCTLVIAQDKGRSD